ncbi:uncharacterized protein LOC143463444 [Clavelina lepadiformis]|uniref:Sushi domain-containing protein n=1 Tax=Clavelina lepadiformis TaxID=159417 RepID=A0ABP0FJL3_CLALP
MFRSGLLLLVFLAAASSACPPIDLPPFSQMNCTWINAWVKQCTFQCQAGVELIGSSVLTCRKGATEWDKIVPICYSDYVDCGKKKCPRISDEEIERYSSMKRKLTPEQMEVIQEGRMIYKSRKLMRSHSKMPCYAKLCRINCIDFRPNNRMINHCRRCKAPPPQGKLKCPKSSGTLFG